MPELKELCKAAGLLVGGKKAELIDRLIESYGGSEGDDGAEEDEAMAPDDEAADEVEEAAEPATASVESAVDEAAVVALLEERGQAKQAKDYEKADEIADTLRSDFNVAVDDKRRTWRVVISYGGYYRVGPKVDDFTTKQVGDLLVRRTAHQELSLIHI